MMKKINEYTSGKLSEAENEKLTGQLIRQQLDREHREAWSRRLQDEHGIFRNTRRKPRIRRLGQLAGLAAAFLLAITAVWFLYPAEEVGYQQLANQYRKDLPISADQWVFRKGPQEVEELRLRANQAFAAETYAEAIRHWEAIAMAGDLSPADRFYLGASYLLTEPTAAEKTLEYLRDPDLLPAEMQQERDWVYALALVLTDHRAEARELLQQIVSGKQYMSAPAKQLLEELPAN